MYDIRRADFNGNTIPKKNQSEYDEWDTFNAYCKNVAASRGYKGFCGTGQEVSRMLDLWNKWKFENRPMPKKAIVIHEIMESCEMQFEFKHWFHYIYLQIKE